MPFQSEKQRRYLHANHPDIAQRWEQEYAGGGIARLPFENGSQWYNPMTWNYGGLFGRAKEGLEGHNAATQDALNSVIAEAGGILEPKGQVNQMSMIPPNFIENLRNLWETDSSDPGVSTDVYNPEAYEGFAADPIAYESFVPNEEFQAYEEFNPTLDEEGIARLIAQAEEEKINYPVEEQISPFKQWSRDFWDQPGKNLWRGANIALNPLNKDNPINMGVGLLAQNIDFPDLRGGQTQGAYNKARQERILAKRIRQRKSDKTQANMERWRDEERKRKFEEETKRMQEQLWQQQAQQVQQNIQTYGNRDRPNTGMNRPGGGRGQSPTGGDVSGTPFAHGGLAGLWHKR